MYAKINFSDGHTKKGAYKVGLHMPKGCNVDMIIAGMQKQIEALQSEFYAQLFKDGVTRDTISIYLEVPQIK